MKTITFELSEDEKTIGDTLMITKDCIMRCELSDGTEEFPSDNDLIDIKNFVCGYLSRAQPNSSSDLSSCEKGSPVETPAPSLYPESSDS